MQSNTQRGRYFEYGNWVMISLYVCAGICLLQTVFKRMWKKTTSTAKQFISDNNYQGLICHLQIMSLLNCSWKMLIIFVTSGYNKTKVDPSSHKKLSHW